MMGKKDAVTKEYMKDPVKFADAFNQYLYDGKQVIRAETLRELDVEEIVLPYGSGGSAAAAQRFRDLLKLAMTDGERIYCIFGVENQGEVHYAAPVKGGLYDFMQLADQVTTIAKAHRKEKGHRPTAGEFLSGFYKQDRLIPVMTLFIYFGTDEWDGPLSLREMYAETDESIIKYVPDYRINLVAPYDMTDEEIGKFKTDLREVMTFLKYAKDKRKLAQVVQKDENFRHLDRETVDLINVTANANVQYAEDEEEVDMCLAIQQMMEESEIKGEKRGERRGYKRGERRGKIQGAVLAYQSINLSRQDTIFKVSETFRMSAQKAEEEVQKYWV